MTAVPEWIVVTEDTHDDGTPSGVVTLTLNRPDQLNALTEPMGDALVHVVARLRERQDLRAVVLTGAGRAFSSGGDLSFLVERSETDAQANSERMRSFYRRYLAIRDLPVPVIAAIQGAAIGAGLCLAAACDLRIAATSAKLGFTFVQLGLHPGMGATHLLPRLIGHQNASRLLLTGEVIDGDEALRMGLVLESVDVAHVYRRAREVARQIAGAGPIAVRSCVRSLRIASDDGFEHALWREADAQAHCYASQDLREGIAAIQERRAPKFLGH